MLSGFITAIRTLTIFPIFGKETKPFYRSLVWFPLVGLFVFALLFLLIEGMQNTISPQLTALLAVLVLAMITRGLHLDGISDLADGFFGAYEKEKILLIMKDSCIGTFGGAALFFVLAFKTLLFFGLITKFLPLTESILPSLLLIGVLSRGGMSLLAASFTYARETGTAEHFITQAGKKEYIITLAWMLGASTLLFGIYGVYYCLGFISLTFLFGLWSKSKIGGITGDVLGAWAELSEIILLFMLLLFPAPALLCSSVGIFGGCEFL